MSAFLNNQGYYISSGNWISEQSLATGSTAGKDSWHHLTYTQQANTGTLYLDGLMVASGVLSAKPLNSLQKRLERHFLQLDRTLSLRRRSLPAKYPGLRFQSVQQSLKSFRYFRRPAECTPDARSAQSCLQPNEFPRKYTQTAGH